MSSILTLDYTGKPSHWISIENAILYHAKKQVSYEIGDSMYVYRGGYQSDGHQSSIRTASIICINQRSLKHVPYRSVPLRNSLLFRRDNHTCAYCGGKFPSYKLSRDHIVPVSKNGLNTWMNCITACKGCNRYKANLSLEQLGLELLYQPYVPNHVEELVFTNNFIDSFQMDFLSSLLPKHTRIHYENQKFYTTTYT